MAYRAGVLERCGGGLGNFFCQVVTYAHCMIWFASSLLGHSMPFSFWICRGSAAACFKIGRLALSSVGLAPSKPIGTRIFFCRL